MTNADELGCKAVFPRAGEAAGVQSCSTRAASVPGDIDSKCEAAFLPSWEQKAEWQMDGSCSSLRTKEGHTVVFLLLQMYL